MEVSWNDLAQQHDIANVQRHQLPKVHEMVKWVTRLVVHGEFMYQNPPRRLVTDNMRSKWHGEHIIQFSAYRVEWGLFHRILP